eukprot:TRINITY_DN80707_c0_g1_i1.p1 TRINITY_DN80707_c0_g1~~TRINITY_DN80707_c0_g1_i1.p1  ORF type:complete len:696 (+),score=92.30 TRINITY_DN80707_c0_g1_i1:29-2089(+)
MKTLVWCVCVLLAVLLLFKSRRLAVNPQLVQLPQPSRGSDIRRTECVNLTVASLLRSLTAVKQPPRVAPKPLTITVVSPSPPRPAAHYAALLQTFFEPFTHSVRGFHVACGTNPRPEDLLTAVESTCEATQCIVVFDLAHTPLPASLLDKTLAALPFDAIVLQPLPVSPRAGYISAQDLLVQVLAWHGVLGISVRDLLAWTAAENPALLDCIGPSRYGDWTDAGHRLVFYLLASVLQRSLNSTERRQAQPTLLINWLDQNVATSAPSPIKVQPLGQSKQALDVPLVVPNLFPLPHLTPRPGDGARLQRLLRAARAGKPLHIASIGGSITEGVLQGVPSGHVEKPFSRRVGEWAKENFPSVTETNAAIRATPSDMLAICGNCVPAGVDLVLIDYDVNGGTPASFEALVRRFLVRNVSVLVVNTLSLTNLMRACSRLLSEALDAFQCESEETIQDINRVYPVQPGSATACEEPTALSALPHQAVAGYYGVPLVSMPWNLWNNCTRLTGFFGPSDPVHFNDAGHAFVAHVIVSYLQWLLRLPDMADGVSLAVPQSWLHAQHGLQRQLNRTTAKGFTVTFNKGWHWNTATGHFGWRTKQKNAVLQWRAFCGGNVSLDHFKSRHLGTARCSVQGRTTDVSAVWGSRTQGHWSLLATEVVPAELVFTCKYLKHSPHGVKDYGFHISGIACAA